MNDGRKKKPQKHKNKTAFKITFDTQALQQQKKVSLNNLCVRCTQQLQWKLQYNKYKKMTEPGRCNICQQKNVFRTYMKACQQCVQKHNLCAKCLKVDYDQPQQVKVLQKDQKKQQKIQYNKQIDFMKTLQQRSRRTVRRGLQKGKISWDNELEYFVDQQGEKMIGLHFRKGFRDNQDDDDVDVMEQGEDDDDMFGDDDDDILGNDDNDQQQQQAEQQPKSKQPDTTLVVNHQLQPTQSHLKSNKHQQEQQQQQHDSDIEGDQVQCDVEVDSDEFQEALGKEGDDDDDLEEDEVDDDDFNEQQQEEQDQKEEEKKKDVKIKANKKK